MTAPYTSGTRIEDVAVFPHELDACGQPGIAVIAGVGEIVRCDSLADGRFNILVEGKARARLEELPFRRPYRRARITLLGTTSSPVEPALTRALSQTATRVAGEIRQCHPAFKFCLPETDDAGVLADACAHYLVLDGAERQRLLEMLDPADRVGACLEALVTQSALLGGETMH
jgi:Lon protease-like protein